MIYCNNVKNLNLLWQSKSIWRFWYNLQICFHFQKKVYSRFERRICPKGYGSYSEIDAKPNWQICKVQVKLNSMCLELSSAYLRNGHKRTVHPNVAFPNGKNYKFSLKLIFGETDVRNWESPTIYNFLTPMRIHKVKCNIENSTNACRWFPTERKILRLGSLYYT